MRSFKLAAVVATVSIAVLSAGACVSTPQRSGSDTAVVRSSGDTPQRVGSDTAIVMSSTNAITADQIAAANLPNAYEIVSRMRRQWFRDMSAGASGEVGVYMDNRRLEGGREALRQIPASDVARLDYLKSADAIMRFGQEASGGAIIVTRK
jgi:hypothetical protein